VAQAFDRAAVTNTVGAPLFAFFAKGGNHERVGNGVRSRADKSCASSIAAHPCKKRKGGAPSTEMAQAEITKGGPPAYNVKEGASNLTTMSATPSDKEMSFMGYTFFPPGKNSPQPFSGDDATDVVINNSADDVSATIHHELRHVLLGDFGRTGNDAQHGLPEVEKQTKEAEKEAVQNEKEQ